jgi:8-oxo-dGTP pyrophosphatase MutT (NUDIX family)
VQAAARTGLHYSRDPYDRQRYEQLAALAAEQYAGLGHPDAAALRDGWALDIGAVTPKIGGGAAIFDSHGRILLMKRTDNLRWCMPGGLCEPLESPETTAVREAREETGLEVEAAALVGVFTRLPDPRYTPYTLVSVLYLCEVVRGSVRGSREDYGLAWREVEGVKDWHGDQRRQAQAAHERWRSHTATG